MSKSFKTCCCCRYHHCAQICSQCQRYILTDRMGTKSTPAFTSLSSVECKFVTGLKEGLDERKTSLRLGEGVRDVQRAGFGFGGGRGHFLRSCSRFGCWQDAGHFLTEWCFNPAFGLLATCVSNCMTCCCTFITIICFLSAKVNLLFLLVALRSTLVECS